MTLIFCVATMLSCSLAVGVLTVKLFVLEVDTLYLMVMMRVWEEVHNLTSMASHIDSITQWGL